MLRRSILGRARVLVLVGISLGLAAIFGASPAASLTQGTRGAQHAAGVRSGLTPIGRGAAPGAKGRLVEKYTTANSDTYELPDGHMLTHVYPEPVNYRDGSGRWRRLSKGQTAARTTTGPAAQSGLASPLASAALSPDAERNPLGQENEAACTLTSTAPTTSACNELTFKAGYETSTKATRRALIQFVLPDLHEELILLNAQLELYVTSTTTTSATAMGAYRVTTPWTTKATWNTSNGSTAWHTPGGDYANPEKESDAAINSSVGASKGWTYWYPTKMVQEWYNGTDAPNGQGQADLGFLIKDVSEGPTNNVVSFAGHEERERDPGLTIEWVDRGVGNATNYTQLPITLSSTQNLDVNPASGNLSIHSNDLQIASKGLEFDSARTWNSLDNEAPDYGYGWVDSNARYVQVATSGNVAYTDGSGNTFPFIKEGAEKFRTPAGIEATMCEAKSASPCPTTLPSGVTYQLIYTKTGERINFGHKESFEPFLYYYVISVEDSAGEKQTAQYTGAMEYPTSWIDTEKTEIAYTESAATGYTKITAKTNPVRSTSYTEPEGEDGLYHLTVYTNEKGEKTTYRYGGESYLEGNLLTEITEPSGNITKLTYNSDYQITKIERIASGQKTGPTTTYTYYELGKAPAPCTSNQRETIVAESGTEKHTIYCANVLDEVEHVAHTWSSAEIVEVCSEYNPETASAEIDEECEATTYGPSSVTETLGGGVAAHYTLSEGEVIYNTPPKGFEPLKASNAELEEYNIPTPPPTGTPEHEVWEHMMSKLHFTEPEPTMVEVHTLSSPGSEVPSQTWSGYLAESESQSYTQVTGKFTVPYAKKEQGCPNATMSAWVGLGGLGEGSPLSQDGFNVVAGAKTDPVWWEVLPATEAFIKKVVATPGGEFIATTHATGPHSRWFFVYNETTGEGHGFTYANNKSSNDEANAEVIGAERTTVNGVETPLLDFASDSAEGWVNNNTLLENAPRLYEVKMWQTTEYNKEGELEGKGPILAQPSKISSLFHSFEDIWKQCGKASSS